MKFNIKNIEDLECSGVYQIRNLINNKYYIGSTKSKLRLRLNHHLQALRNNTHKNGYLQNAWNKYGENNFEFSILEICSVDIVYDREQYYLDNRNVTLSYNINPKATGPCLTEDCILKQSVSRKKFNELCNYYYIKYKNNEITLTEIPEKFIATIKGRSHYVWNKGKKYSSTEHLKVPHKITEKTIKKCKDFSEKRREDSDIVYVYDKNYKFINSFRSAIDLADLSTKIKLPLKSRFSKKRGNCELNKLQSCNINRAIKTHKTYKSLYFYNKPLHQGIDDVNEPISVKTWNGNTEINIETKKSISSYSIETEPENNISE